MFIFLLIRNRHLMSLLYIRHCTNSFVYINQFNHKVLPREHTGYRKHPLPTTQETALHMDIIKQYQNQIDYTLCSRRWRSSVQSAKTRPGADCGSDHQLFMAKFRLKLKKVGKTTRPFRYDLMSSITNSKDMNLGKLWKIARDKESCHAVVHGVTKSQT